MRFFNEVFDESTNNPAVSDDLSCVPASADGDVTRLHFQLDDYLRDSVRQVLRESTASLDCAFYCLLSDVIKDNVAIVINFAGSSIQNITKFKVL